MKLTAVQADRNIKISYLISFLSDFNFYNPIWLLFYLQFLSYQELGILMTAQAIISIVMEVPTGAFADIFGRKLSVFLAFILYGTAYAFQAFTTTFNGFLILVFIKGLSEALFSGSFEALTYDTLKEQGKEETYKKVTANIQSFLWLGLLLSSTVGGFIYDNWYQLPLLLTAGIYMITALFAFFFTEPHIDTEKYNVKKYFSQNFIGFKELFKTTATSQISWFLITLGAAGYISSNLLGVSLIAEYNLSGGMTGLLQSIGYLLTVLFSQAYPYLHKKLGDKKILFVYAIILTATFFFAKFVGLIIGSILIITRISLYTIFNNTKSNVVNSFVESKNRATALSSMMLLTKLPYAMSVYVIGVFIEKYSANEFATFMAIVIIILFGLQWFYFKTIAADK